MNTRSFQARSVSELLDASIRLLKEHYKSLLLLSAIGSIPWLLVGLTMPQLAPGDEPTPEQMAEIFASMWLFIFPLMWSLIVWTAMIAHAADLYLGREASPTAALGRTLRRSPALLWSTIMKWFLIQVISMAISIPIIFVVAIGAVFAGSGAGTIVMIVLFIVAYIAGIAISAAVYARFFFASTVLVVEHLGPWKAIARSLDLTKGHHWRVAKAYILVFILVFVVWGTAYGILYAISGNLPVSAVVGQAVMITVFPLIPVATALLYYDLRIRKEGYDLELMAQSLGGSLPQARAAEGVRGA